MTYDRDANERLQIEEVFGLTGGELEVSPWIPVQTENEANFKFTYWYADVPSYAESDFTDWSTAEYRTVVRDEMFGQVPETVADMDGTWDVVARFSSSGECECPGRRDDGQFAREMPVPCPYCEIGEEDKDHGYIYIGDGWAEIVYRKRRDPNMTRNDNGSWYCEDCRKIVILFDDDEHDCQVTGTSTCFGNPGE